MRIAFTHNVQVDPRDESQAEFDTPETVDLIASGLTALGHDVEPIECSGAASELVARLEKLQPDLVFNTAEGTRGRFREAFFPAVFDRLGLPYTGSDAYVCTLTLDKQLSKLIVDRAGVPTPKWTFVDADTPLDVAGMRFPLIVKPNSEGSSIGITPDSVVDDDQTLAHVVEDRVARFPAGVIVEEFIVGRDVVVPWLELGPSRTGGVLEPVVYDFDPAYTGSRKYELYDYHLKTFGFDGVKVRVPADILPEQRLLAMGRAARAFRALGIRDLGRVDFRLGEDGEIYFLEVNALPSLERGASLYRSGALAQMPTEADVLDVVVRSAAARNGAVTAGSERVTPLPARAAAPGSSGR
jgi:D-alanine-D-alanine ligase